MCLKLIHVELKRSFNRLIFIIASIISRKPVAIVISTNLNLREYLESINLKMLNIIQGLFNFVSELMLQRQLSLPNAHNFDSGSYTNNVLLKTMCKQKSLLFRSDILQYFF